MYLLKCEVFWNYHGAKKFNSVNNHHDVMIDVVESNLSMIVNIVLC